jgi:hypothetical protein
MADADNSFVLSAVGLTLDILTSVKQLDHAPKKRKRGYGSADNVQNLLTLNMLLKQPFDCISKRIKLSPQMVRAHKTTIECFQHFALPVITTGGNIKVEVKTVEDDNANLVFDRPGRKVCIKGQECTAFLIDGPPQKPLTVYDGPSGASTGLCLLCIRNEAATLCQLHQSQGCKPRTALLPPFTNICDKAGGYRREFMGVLPEYQDTIAGGVHIMGSCTAFTKQYDAHKEVFYIDQGPSIYRSSSLN